VRQYSTGGYPSDILASCSPVRSRISLVEFEVQIYSKAQQIKFEKLYHIPIIIDKNENFKVAVGS